LLLSSALDAAAADLFGAAPAALLRRESVAVEVSAGYLTANAKELVYNVPGDGTKVSQLNWNIDRAAVIAARLSYRPLDWLSLRARGWMTVAPTAR
jgi:plasminogen activator